MGFSKSFFHQNKLLDEATKFLYSHLLKNVHAKFLSVQNVHFFGGVQIYCNIEYNDISIYIWTKSVVFQPKKTVRHAAFFRSGKNLSVRQYRSILTGLELLQLQIVQSFEKLVQVAIQTAFEKTLQILTMKMSTRKKELTTSW